MKDRHRKRIRTEVVRRTDKATLQSFINSFVIGPGAAIYTNKASAYEGLPNHEAVKHSTGEYVRRMAHNGTFHKMSPKHLNRYVTEFEGRYNIREQDTDDQLTMVAQRMVGKRLRYRDLIKPNGLDSAARSASFAGPKPASSLHFLQQKAQRRLDRRGRVCIRSGGFRQCSNHRPHSTLLPSANNGVVLGKAHGISRSSPKRCSRRTGTT